MSSGEPVVMLDAWQVKVPEGWGPVASLCGELFEERAAITELINDRIRAEVQEFREPVSVINRRDLAWSTGGGVANFLRGVAELAPPTERDDEFQRLVGKRSAILGLPLEPLIASYQVGFRELWTLLATRSGMRDDGASQLLLQHGSIVWERLVATTTAVREGYQQELAERQAFEVTATAHLIETIENGALAEAHTLARELGFDPDGPFRVIDVAGPVTIEERCRMLVSRLVGTGVASMARRGRGVVVVTQGADDTSVRDALSVLPSDATVGVGGVALGLEGVLATLREALLAQGATRVGVSWFEQDWLRAVLMAERAAVERTLRPGIELATNKPHLADAVRAFADAGFSIAESAINLQISPSSQRYRLTRWGGLTGWDPWTMHGLIRSLVSIELARTPS